MKPIVCMIILLPGWILAQTQVDLKSQSRNVDFSGVATVRPFPVGTTLPATCTTGSMFFRSNASAGANLYGCIGADTWSLESGGGGGGTFELPLGLSKTSPNILAIGSGCSVAVPCTARIGAVTHLFSADAAIQSVSGDGTVYVYIDHAGNLTAGATAAGSPALSCTGCQVATPILGFPVDSLPLGQWNVNLGQWTATGTDSRAVLSAAPSFSAGSNILLSQTPGNVTISAVLAALPTGIQPTCAEGTKGSLWYTAGAMGVKDDVQVCAKDGSDMYSWRTLY